MVDLGTWDKAKESRERGYILLTAIGGGFPHIVNRSRRSTGVYVISHFEKVGEFYIMVSLVGGLSW